MIIRPMDSLSLSLELEARCELQAAHRGSILGGDNARNRSGIAVLAVYAGVRLPKVGVIEDIECFSTQLEPHTFTNIKGFGERQIGIEESWSKIRIASNIAECPDCRTRERSERRLRATRLQCIRRRCEVSNLVRNRIERTGS